MDISYSVQAQEFHRKLFRASELSLFLSVQIKLCHNLSAFQTEGVCSDFIVIW